MIAKHLNYFIHNYRIEPGDGTCYRFGYQRFHQDPDKAYIVDSGVGEQAYQNYVWAYVKMASSSGVATIPIWDLKNLNLHELAGYLKTHGFEQVQEYTLYAVLLALSVLVAFPGAVNKAAERMLKAPEYL